MDLSRGAVPSGDMGQNVDPKPEEEHDFSEFEWMGEDMEEFDRQVEQQLMEEFLIETCVEQMLREEDEEEPELNPEDLTPDILQYLNTMQGNGVAGIVPDMVNGAGMDGAGDVRGPHRGQGHHQKNSNPANSHHPNSTQQPMAQDQRRNGPGGDGLTDQMADLSLSQQPTSKEALARGSRLNPNAPAFVFNPNAVTFVPRSFQPTATPHSVPGAPNTTGPTKTASPDETKIVLKSTESISVQKETDVLEEAALVTSPAVTSTVVKPEDSRNIETSEKKTVEDNPEFKSVVFSKENECEGLPTS